MDFGMFASDVQEMFQVDQAISEHTPLEGNEWWDSMAYLYIITYAEEKLGINVEFDELRPAKTLGELYSILSAHK